MGEPSTITGARAVDGPSAAVDAARRVAALVIAWSVDAPHRAGEIAFIESSDGDLVLGRGEGDSADGRIRFFRQRPGELSPTEPLQDPALSRKQLLVRARGGKLEVQRVGRCPLVVSGKTTDHAFVQQGDTVLLGSRLVLLCTRRPRVMPETLHYPMADATPFGQADAAGMLGESPCAWQLRDDLAFAAASGKHVLLQGPSGAGKELAARAIHHHSPRASRPFVARNAATIPSSLVDAELFGNAKNYPNAGMAERPGLVAKAHESTLFLDEVGELSFDLQAHLLRVLDRGGEYQRLGDATPRHSDLLLVGATNRDLDRLKQDLLARFALRICLPGLDARREDLPLLIRHLLLDAARTSRHAERFLRREADRLEPRLEPALVDSLLRRTYESNVRELEALLWRAMAASRGDTVVLPEELHVHAPSPSEPTEQELRATLEREKGNVRRSAQALGLPSRYALYRLMKKRGINVEAPTDGREE